MADLAVQVCYALPERQVLKDLRIDEGATIRQAIRASGILEAFPEIDPENCKVGIFGKLKTLDTPLRDQDRVEIYRPLVADPKESRRRRAEKKGNGP